MLHLPLSLFSLIVGRVRNCLSTVLLYQTVSLKMDDESKHDGIFK